MLSTGCTADVLGRMKGFDVAQIIISQPVREAVDRAKNVGRLLASIEALLLAFVCWYRVHTGRAMAHRSPRTGSSASSSAHSSC